VHVLVAEIFLLNWGSTFHGCLTCLKKYTEEIKKKSLEFYEKLM